MNNGIKVPINIIIMYNNNIIIMQSDSSTLKTAAHCTILTNVNTILTNVKRESIFALAISEDSFSIRSGRQSCRMKKKRMRFTSHLGRFTLITCKIIIILIVIIIKYYCNYSK